MKKAIFKWYHCFDFAQIHVLHYQNKVITYQLLEVFSRIITSVQVARSSRFLFQKHILSFVFKYDLGQKYQD